MLPLIPLISLASSVVPELIGLFGGKRAGEVATKVADVVHTITGTDDPQAAAEAIKADPAKATELRVKLEEIKQRYVELQIADAKSEREAMIEALKQEVLDRQRASSTMLEALKLQDWTGKLVGLTPMIISAVVLIGFFVFTIWMLQSPPDAGSTVVTLLNVLIGALVAGFTAVINFWLGSSQGSRDKDKAAVALQEAHTETINRVQKSSADQLEAVTKAVRPVVEAAHASGTTSGPQPGVPSRFELCADLVLDKEGGFSDHREDPGGPTMLGITQRTLSAWRHTEVTADDVRTLQRKEALDIYRANYWNAMRCDSLPKGIDLMVFDFGVNAGPGTSVKLLQKVAGAEQDGSIGELTLRAVRSHEPVALIKALSVARMEYYRQLKTFATFGAGWENRTNDITRQAMLMAQG